MDASSTRQRESQVRAQEVGGVKLKGPAAPGRSILLRPRAARGRGSPRLLLAACDDELYQHSRVSEPIQDPARFPWHEVTKA